MKIALGQMQVIPGRPDLNALAMKLMIEEAKDKGAQLIIFPELCIPGYLLGDTWEQLSFLRDCENWGKEIIASSQEICIVFGNVAVDWNKTGHDGRVRKYNACFIAYQGKLWGEDNFLYPFRIKTLHPNYREFDDSRHFYSLPQLALEQEVDVKELLQPVHLLLDGTTVNLGCLLCEDGWSDDYALKPMSLMIKNSPVDLFVNISSSPFTLGKNSKRNRTFSRQVKESAVPLAYVNSTGIQNNGKTVYTFDGLSSLYNEKGEVVSYCPAFTSTLQLTDLCSLKSHERNETNETSPCLPCLEKNDTEEPSPCVACVEDWGIHHIYQALFYGTKLFLESIGIKKVVIGLSGGIDSAVNACLYSQVLGRENVLLVNMPSVYNSETTKSLAARLANNLGCLYGVIPIQEAVDFTVKQINETPIFNFNRGENINLAVSSFIKENIQARDRSARILASLSAAFGGGFTCNANKSEITVGYSTLYGDQAGFLTALGDLWKHQVYELARYFNSEIFKKEIIPQEIIDLVPSAELSPEQNVDEGKGDPIRYPYHDYLFKAFMEHWNRATPEDVLEWYRDRVLEEKIGCQAGLIEKLFSDTKVFIDDLEYWWKQYSGMGVAKRIQAPPILAVSRRAYGFDHREAQNGPYFTAKYHKLKQEILNP